MKLGYNGATTMTSPFETDVRIAGAAGFDVLEITATKLDKYLQTHTLADARKLIDAAKLKTHAINSIEKINSRDAAERQKVLARTRRDQRMVQRARVSLDYRGARSHAVWRDLEANPRRNDCRAARDERHQRAARRQPRVRVSRLSVVLGADGRASVGNRQDDQSADGWHGD